MAIPPMIGHPGATLLYSGSRAVFDTHEKTLERLGVAAFLSDDPGTAPLYDIALLSAMYGLFGGALHALAMVRPGEGRATEFTSTLLLPWLQAMMASVPEFARQLDSGELGTRAANSNLAMQAAAYVNLLDASAAEGVDPLLVRPMGELLHRAVAAGHGDGDVPALATLLRARPPHRRRRPLNRPAAGGPKATRPPTVTRAPRVTRAAGPSVGPAGRPG
ncbi:hypothetical protein E1283_21980 [Streptomyces hainanensis]|uniref:NADPH-dependent reductive aminase-like C-terminal domain-containing protein n=2 Tax=Streptomyces hainanensis TaxID=402648 RepID=A0A4R4T5Z5_9ACTN|nr:hypothetical protein E1283_21980 [Streptomyces hainanensis]